MSLYLVTHSPPSTSDDQEWVRLALVGLEGHQVLPHHWLVRHRLRAAKLAKLVWDQAMLTSGDQLLVVRLDGRDSAAVGVPGWSHLVPAPRRSGGHLEQ